MPKIKVALIDDHQIVRDGLTALLHDLDRFEVVAEAGSGDEALAISDTTDVDVFLMDISMPNMDGLDATRRILRRCPAAKIIILSMYDTPSYVSRAIAFGARGYMLKNMAAQEIEHAISKVASGGTYVSPSIETVPGDATSAPDAALLTTLTERQQEILITLANGKTTRDIATALSISAKTVESHRSEVMRKLDIYDVPGLVKFAIRNGLVNVE